MNRTIITIIAGLASLIAGASKAAPLDVCRTYIRPPICSEWAGDRWNCCEAHLPVAVGCQLFQGKPDCQQTGDVYTCCGEPVP